MNEKIKGHRYSIDWVYPEIKEVETKDIWGVKLHWRGTSWHIEIITKEKCTDGYYHYEVGHWVDDSEAKRIYNHKDINLLGIYTNTPNNFKEGLKKLFT